jgi:D-xylose transport system permease protein
MSSPQEVYGEKEKINPLLASQQQQSLGDYVRGYFQRLVSGDLGSLPIIIGLIVIAIIFQSANSNFLTPRNFVNLILQMSGTTMIAYGVVFVLLLGDIDLSIGYVSAVGGVSVAILLQVTDVMGLAVDGVMPDTLPPQARIFLFLRQYGLILFPLVLAGGRLIWYFLRRGADKSGQNQVFIEAAVFAVVGILLALLFQIANGWTWYNTIAVAIVITAAIGLLHGFIITFFRVPSFIVTLAGLLAWNGVVLKIIGSGGTVIVQDDFIEGIANSYLPKIGAASDVLPAGLAGANDIVIAGFNFGHPVLSWGLIVLLACVAGFAAVQLTQYNSRKSQGLSTTPVTVIVGQIVGLTLIAILVAHISDQDRGVPVVGLLLLVFLVFLNFVTTSTQFGRFVYAVGGNAEAARRAGINVTQIRMIVFMISSVMAGLGGIVLASRLRSVDTGAGGGNLLLNAVASAVIGGTSLFGGRGHVSSAVLGALVIIGVDNGMGLLNLSSGDKFIITGIVLIVAVVVDALSQRRQQQAGLR